MPDVAPGSGQERHTLQAPTADVQQILPQPTQTGFELPGEPDSGRTETASTAAPAPEHRSAATLMDSAGSRFAEDLPSSKTDPFPPRDSSTPAPARSAPGKLLDRARRGWQAVKPWVNRAVKFAKENPWIFRGMAAGAVVGLAVAGPAGMVLGAQAGALAGTVAQVSVRAIQNRRLAAKGSPHSSTSATEATSGMSTAVQDAARPQTPTASTDRSRSRQLGGPEYMEARLAGPIMSGQVAAIAARRASGTSSTAPSVTGTVWAPPSRPVTPVAKSPRRS